MAATTVVATEPLMVTLAPSVRGQWPQPDDLGARLAAFAVGCLGAQAPAKAGGRLGVMGSASEEEFLCVLAHLETLTRQRAAKLANVAPKDASPDSKACTEAFASALLRACGMPAADVAGLFARLPHDNAGRADLLRVFGLSTSQAALQATSGALREGLSHFRQVAEGVPADYVERPADLPGVTAEAFAQAVSMLEATTAADSEGAWAECALALNVLRSAIASCLSEAQIAQVDATLVSAVAGRCNSRRPALAKCALRALGELADCRAGVAWAGATQRAIEGCLGALRGTKVVTRLAEETLNAVVLRADAEHGTAESLNALASCLAVEVAAASPQPVVAAAGLRVVATLVTRVESSACQATAAVTALCESVLACRRLSPAFSQARAVLHGLPKCEGQAQGRVEAEPALGAAALPAGPRGNSGA